MKNYLKKNNQLRYKKFFLSLKIYNYFKNMTKENINQEFRLKKIGIIEEVNRNELMSKTR